MMQVNLTVNVDETLFNDELKVVISVTFSIFSLRMFDCFRENPKGKYFITFVKKVSFFKKVISFLEAIIGFIFQFSSS